MNESTYIYKGCLIDREETNFSSADILNYSRLGIRETRRETLHAPSVVNDQSTFQNLFLFLYLSRELEARHPVREPPT